MERTLQEEIADYNQMVETTRQNGRCLRQRLQGLGWHLVDRLLDAGYSPCAIHPDFWAEANENGDIVFDDEDEFHYFNRSLTEEEQEKIVELWVV
jgi:hypothetical protein